MRRKFSPALGLRLERKFDGPYSSVSILSISFHCCASRARSIARILWGGDSASPLCHVFLSPPAFTVCGWRAAAIAFTTVGELISLSIFDV